ncbi:hypothetical protein IOD14_37180 [Streptomyces sp. A2-16]|uniref:hypothetical protein n=1 Tax=Streptomyces sp. A2-16 TaxID=2781734 RepID=UPI001BAF0B9B|nr:hypothetical protein [Streptomyces sp. A2-16]QUC61954.1 hypothetical protein IOD14_37180 [Streptomyces sp. A2-16]
MDQGVAAVWAAGLAGLASAAGAAVGAGVAARGVRMQALQARELEKQTKEEERRLQHHDWRRQNCLAFQAKLGEAVDALDALMDALSDGESLDEVRGRLRQAEGAVLRGHYDLVMTCQVAELERISGAALRWLEQTLFAIDALRRDPAHVANHDSPLSQHCLDQRRGLLGSYEMFSKALPQVLPVS